MAGFIYYLPGSGEVISRERIVAAGLGSIVRTQGMTHRGVRSGGPDGGAGMLIVSQPQSPEGVAAECGVFEGRQTWQRHSGGDCWLGFETDRPPSPADLRRAEVVAGYPIELADGAAWTIPMGRVCTGETRFARRLRLGPDGQWVSEVLPAFQALCDEARRVHGYLTGDGLELEDSAAIELAVRLLAVNYRVGRDEVSMLGLLTTSNLFEMLKAFVDVPGMAALAALAPIPDGLGEAEKKNGWPAD